MSSKYFYDCRTKGDLKPRFKELLKIYHPDNGGNVQVMQEINAEYANLMKILPDEVKSEKQREPDTNEISDILKAVLEKIANIPGLAIEICGTWIWVSGNTYPIRETLKSIGFKFSGKKKMWYFHEETEGIYKRRHKKETDMETIRSKYGSNEIHRQAACLA